MRIYLAGLENKTWKPFAISGKIKNCFGSFYYMREDPNMGHDQLEYLRKHINNVTIDSGAHSFFSEMQGAGMSVSNDVKKTKTKETPDAYFERYVNWLKINYQYYDYFVELDIGEIVTQKKVLEWRERLKKEKLYSKCITVYHPRVVTMEDWIKTIEDSESKYVAVEGDRPNRLRLSYNKLIEPAYKRGVRIHGFALCDKRVIDRYPFFSVDSTSWIAGIKYGSGFSVMDSGFGFVNHRIKSEKLFALAKQHYPVMDLFGDNNSKAYYVDGMIAIDGYNKMQKHYTDLWKLRGIQWK